MKSTPAISVLMTAYNREQFIAESITSVLESTFKNFELIIVDDCSTDRTADIVKGFAKKDSRIQVYVNDKKLGQFANRNKALRYAKGDLIKYFDSDDIMYSDFLSTIVDAMEKFPEAMAGGGVHECIKECPTLFSPREMYVSYFNGINLLSVIPSSVIFRKEVFEELGEFPTDVGVFGDTLFALRSRARFPWVGFESNKFFYRVHEGQEMDVGSRDRIKAMLYWHHIKEGVLDSEYCPLSISEVKIFKRNSKNITIRNSVLPALFNGNFKFVSRIQKEFKFSIIDYLRAVLPNKRIK